MELISVSMDEEACGIPGAEYAAVLFPFVPIQGTTQKKG